MKEGRVIHGAAPDVSENVLADLREALKCASVVRADLQRVQWTEEGREPWETTALALELDDPPTGEELPADLVNLLEGVFPALGESSGHVEVSIPSVWALDGLRRNGVLIYERGAA
jgi:hypothetical protein